MASCNVVNVLCPNGRRQKVKVTSHMSLLQLIQEVCKKQNLDANNCAIKHQRKILDSSLAVRFANLPNNAHLELVESAEVQVHKVKKCVVALQLQSGDRLVHEFDSNQSLFSILEHWRAQQGSKISFNDNADGIACIYASQEIKTLEKLKSTTLSTIGLNGGRGIIRLIQPSSTNSEKGESEVMEGVCEKPSPEKPKVEPVIAPTAVPAKLSTEEMEVESRTASSVSMTSQTSDDYSMQCSETTADQPPASAENSVTQHPNTKSQKNKKTQKHQEMAMDVEQCEAAANQSKAKTQEAHGTTKENTADTARSAATVQVFSGIGRTLSETGPEIKKARLHSPPTPGDQPQVKTSKVPETATKCQESVGEINRDTVVFKLGDDNPISSDEDISDEFFEVTIDDLRLMLKDLKNERTVETPLLTKTMRENREKTKMEKYDKVAIRIYFPDRSVLQGMFAPTEKVEAVYIFVKENLQISHTNFYLYTTPPRILLDKPTMTLFQAKLVPAAVIHFGSNETQDFYLNTTLMKQKIDVMQANEKVGNQCRPSVSSLKEDIPENTSKNTVTNNERNPETKISTSSEPEKPTEENVPKNINKTAKPKWFNLGKK